MIGKGGKKNIKTPSVPNIISNQKFFVSYLWQGHHGGLQLSRSGDTELAVGVWETTTFIVRAVTPC